MNNTDSYSVLYKINMGLVINQTNVINVSSSDIVSIMMLHNYDKSTYPVIRIRLYSDISLIQQLTEYPNDISIRCNMDGGIYRMNSDDKTPVICNATKSISFQLKCYLENKNTPTSVADNYENGLPKSSDLNSNVKVPIELYCYDEYVVHMMKQRVSSIFNNTSVLSVVHNIFSRNSLFNYSFDEFANQDKYEQILIPNMSIISALSYIDIKYGFYQKGAQLYCDVDNIYICDSNVNNVNATPYPIYVNSPSNNTDMGGVTKYGNGYYMTTLARNVSVISETDIERVLNSKNLSAINLTDLSLTTKTLDKLYASSPGYIKNKYDNLISTPNILHKSLNQGLVDSYIARVNEKITRIDVSGVGFDIEKIKINSRYNLIFESPMRGMSMNDYYRASYACHVITNLDSDLFIAQTTMNLCNN